MSPPPSATSASDPRPRASLLSLPTEIRLQIFTHLSADTITDLALPSSPLSSPVREAQDASSPPTPARSEETTAITTTTATGTLAALRLTSRRLASEAREIFFRSAAFHFHVRPSAPVFVLDPSASIIINTNPTSISPSLVRADPKADAEVAAALGARIARLDPVARELVSRVALSVRAVETLRAQSITATGQEGADGGRGGRGGGDPAVMWLSALPNLTDVALGVSTPVDARTGSAAAGTVALATSLQKLRRVAAVVEADSTDTKRLFYNAADWDVWRLGDTPAHMLLLRLAAWMRAQFNWNLEVALEEEGKRVGSEEMGVDHFERARGGMWATCIGIRGEGASGERDGEIRHVQVFFGLRDWAHKWLRVPPANKCPSEEMFEEKLQLPVRHD